MKGFLTAAVASLAVSQVSGHYIFQQLTTGGTKHPVWKYIRQNTNYNSPVTDLSSNDLRCNEGGASGRNTETIEVRAGDSFTFTLDTPVYHQGPVSVYLSKAPGSAADYDGSGPWFKIKDWGPTFGGGGAQWTLSGSYTANLPVCIPNGEYLLRIQNIGIHNPYPAALPQFYISCAQIRVTGGGNTNPSPTALIPGAFKATDPGYTANIYNNFNSYIVPGPSVFSCGSNGGGIEAPPASTTLATSTRPATQPTNAPAPGCTNPVAKWGQCGGNGFSGSTCCAAGSTCNAINQYYSQCV
ncbi:glycosyl hydrolase family 61-domain-containing protein [Podospora fimiseda]|uniref:lytic cellulose monooxygenase (C4-dehydrogenating) n=1 Tax=Podospora fimiseda TaxID=252190 RepID=A0AAN7GQZ0_9PEZI|nr:glycosyl hydrolase family 61-domain-containing protein [Podospora fimiseda]